MVRAFSRYISLKSVLLMSIEATLILFSLWIASKVRYWGDTSGFELYTDSAGFFRQAPVILAVLEICFYYSNLYDMSRPHLWLDQFSRICQAVGASCIVLWGLLLVFPGLLVGRGVLILSVPLVLTTVTLVRTGWDKVWRLTAESVNVAILGEGSLALAVAREFSRRDDLNVRVFSFGDQESNSGLYNRPRLGSVDSLLPLVQANKISRIVIALDDSRGALPTRDLVRLRVRGIKVEDAPSVLAALTGRIWLGAVRPSWFVFSSGFHRSTVDAVLKRSIDLACGLLGLVFAAPLMGLIAAAIRLDSKGPVLYRQTRIGLSEKPFELLKFRSMRVDAEANGAQWSQESDPRITRVGRFLRKYRLDEIPQLINVMRGEMSLVGPRPERPVFVEQLRDQIPFYDERHSVRPGVTGWAQVEYKYGASIEDSYRKLEYDLFYLKNMSLFFDLRIIARTFRVVFLGHGGR
jgi:sugar transferase (PEP-CTERM system associated)